MAAQKRSVADVLSVDLQTKSRWQKNAQWGEDAQDLRSISELLKIDRQSDIVSVFGGDALDHGADFGAGSRRRRLTDDLPVAMLRPDFAISCLRYGGLRGESQHEQDC